MRVTALVVLVCTLATARGELGSESARYKTACVRDPAPLLLRRRQKVRARPSEPTLTPTPTSGRAPAATHTPGAQRRGIAYRGTHGATRLRDCGSVVGRLVRVRSWCVPPFPSSPLPSPPATSRWCRAEAPVGPLVRLHTCSTRVASSYVFRPDASTSNGTGSSTTAADQDGAPSPPLKPSRSTFFDSSAAGSPSSSSTASKRLSVRMSEPCARLPSAGGGSAGGGSATATLAGIPRGDAEDLVDEINVEENLYKILGVKRRAKTDEVRRAFLARSRIIHPEYVQMRAVSFQGIAYCSRSDRLETHQISTTRSKLPFYAPSTTAFQRLSFAYETLSKPSSRRLYDLRGPREFDPGKQAPVALGHLFVPRSIPA